MCRLLSVMRLPALLLERRERVTACGWMAPQDENQRLQEQLQQLQHLMAQASPPLLLPDALLTAASLCPWRTCSCTPSQQQHCT
jgi:hypothetical protein